MIPHYAMSGGTLIALAADEIQLDRHAALGPVDPQRAADLAELLATGVWTHDHPLMASDLEQLGLPIKVGVPAEERELMDLYPQARGNETSDWRLD